MTDTKANYPDLMQPDWAADYLDVSPGTMRRYIRDGVVPVHKPGGKLKSRILIARADLDALLAASRVEAATGPLVEPRRP